MTKSLQGAPPRRRPKAPAPLKPLHDLDLIPSHLAVLREIHRAGAATRVDLAKSTGLSAQSLTRLTKQLIDDGFLTEGERRIQGRGQPAIYLSIAPGRLVSFGLVFEHDQITCVANELGGGLVFYLKRRGAYAEARHAVAEATAMLAAAVAQAPADAYALGVGASISGFFLDAHSRRAVSRNDVEGWINVDLTTDLPLPVPMPVFVENDGRAAAMGQAVDGVGKNLESFFLVLMTKGIGGGFVNRGRLVRGRLGNAGEIATFVPKTPSVWRPTSEALARRLNEKWGLAPNDAEIEDAVRRGDPTVNEWLDNAASGLLPALHAVNALIDPQAIIFAGRLSPSVRRALADRIRLEGVSYAGYEAPAPEVIIDPKTDCLTVGAYSLPVASLLYS